MPGDDSLFQMSDRLRRVEVEQAETRETIMSFREIQQSISNSLERLVRLEERHAETRDALSRAFAGIEKLSEATVDMKMSIPDKLLDRLNAIETKMPGLIEMRRWLMAGVMSVVGLVFVEIMRFASK